jgi:hypothetical protein
VSGSTVGLTFGAAKAIYFSASQDSGKTFSSPVKVAEAEILPLNRHRGPRIVMSGGIIAISAVGGKKLAEGPARAWAAFGRRPVDLAIGG